MFLVAPARPLTATRNRGSSECPANSELLESDLQKLRKCDQQGVTARVPLDPRTKFIVCVGFIRSGDQTWPIPFHKRDRQLHQWGGRPAWVSALCEAGLGTTIKERIHEKFGVRLQVRSTSVKQEALDQQNVLTKNNLTYQKPEATAARRVLC